MSEQQPPGRRPDRLTPGPDRLTVAVVVGAVLLALVLIPAALVRAAHPHPDEDTGSRHRSRPAPSAPSTPALPEQDARVVWKLDPAKLRPGLKGVKFLAEPDGDFNSDYLAPVGGLWLALTGLKYDRDIRLHAVDPDTGKVRWQRDLDGALCTTEAPKDSILCASVIKHGRYGLGTRWRLHLIDPATGRDRRTTDVDGWLTAVHYAHGHFVLVEQRQPAPHVVLQSYDAGTLRRQWVVDLAHRPGQQDLFSVNRIVNREQVDRPGLALDRPRIRDVGDGLLALWSGQRTVFVQRDSGKLIMMPHCSRLVDDGERLWCNEPDDAAAYSYRGKLLYRTEAGIRLAFPYDDGVGEDVNRPVFIDPDGSAVAVNRRTGTGHRRYSLPGNGSAFGVTTSPAAYTVGDHTLVSGDSGTMLLDPDHDKISWINRDITQIDLPIMIDSRHLLVGTFHYDRVDLRTGRSSGRVRSDALYVRRVGDRISGQGPDAISLLRIGS